MLFDFQVNTATTHWPDIREQALTAEANGFDAVWVWDHLTGMTMGGGHTMSDCFTVLGALAAATTTVNIGPLVANVQNRHPAMLANAAATVQNISDGRLLLGLGAGGGPNGPFTAEHRTAGISLLPHLTQRHDFLMESLTVMDHMWADDRDAKYRGFPKPVSVPPRFVGLNSEHLATLSGQHADGVNVRARADTSRGLLDLAKRAAGDRPFVLTVFFPFDEEFLDPDHELRVRFGDVDRTIFVALRPTDPTAITRGAKRLGIA